MKRKCPQCGRITYKRYCKGMRVKPDHPRFHLFTYATEAIRKATKQ